MTKAKSTNWRRGQSGNPSGRPKKTPELLEVEMLARQASPMAIERLVAWAQSKDPSASPKACLALLDRAWGKPQQAIEHKRSPNLALQINIVGTPVHERPREIEVQANLVKPNGSHP